jgi:hypothetical protein
MSISTFMGVNENAGCGVAGVDIDVEAVGATDANDDEAAVGDHLCSRSAREMYIKRCNGYQRVHDQGIAIDVLVERVLIATIVCFHCFALVSNHFRSFL